MKFHEKESKKVSYQGIAHLEMNGIHFIAVGDYYDGHAGLVPGKVYSLTVEA